MPICQQLSPACLEEWGTEDSIEHVPCQTKRVYPQKYSTSKEFSPRIDTLTNKQTEMALQPATTPEVQEAEQNEAKKVAHLPNDGSISARISRILLKFDIKCVFCPASNITALVGNVKDNLGL